MHKAQEVNDGTKGPGQIGVNTMRRSKEAKNQMLSPPVRSIAPQDLSDFCLDLIKGNFRNLSHMGGKAALRNHFSTQELCLDLTRQGKGPNVANVENDLMGLIFREIKSDALRSVNLGTKHINSFLKHKIRKRQTNTLPSSRIRGPSHRFTSIKLLTDKDIPESSDFNGNLEVGNMLDFCP